MATSAAAAVAVANGRGYFQKYDDADLEIYEYLCPPMRTICRRFPIMEAATGSVFFFVKKISQNSQENSCAREVFSTKFQAWGIGEVKDSLA